VLAIQLPVGEDHYALPIEAVRQVVATSSTTPLVTAPDVVLGLFNLRGEIVPVLDVAALLGLGRIEPMTVVVVVNTPHGPAALAVTGMPERIELVAPIGDCELPAARGTYQVGDHLVVLLDIDALLTGLRAAEPIRLAGAH
jgi:purine-binding chemotaxis protein CheW